MDEELRKILENLQRIRDGGGSLADAEEYLRAEGFQSMEHWNLSQRVGRFVSPDSPLMAGMVRSDALRNAPRSEQLAAKAARNLTLGDAARLATSGVIPGWGDNLIAMVRAGVDPNLTYEEALKQEGDSLAAARAKDFATTLELGAGLLTAVGAEVALAKAGGKVANVVKALTGFGQGAPRSVIAGTGQGARIGAFYGAMQGSGDSSGDVWDRLLATGSRAAIGGAAGGLLSAGGTAIMGKPALDPSDMTSLFGTSSTIPAGARAGAVRDLAALTERQGINPAAERATAFRDVPPEVRLPTVAADFLGPEARGRLRQVGPEAPVPVQRQTAKPLVERARTRPERSGRAVETIAGRTPQVKDEVLPALTAERRAVNDVMYQRARDAAAARGNTRALTSPEIQTSLQNPEVVKAVEKVRARMQDATRRGTAHPDEVFVDPYLRDDKGRIIYKTNRAGEKLPQLRPFQQQDPTTIYNVAQELGQRAERFMRTGKALEAKPLQEIKSIFDREVVAVNPELVEANHIAHLLRERERAAELALRPRTGTRAAYERAVEPWRAMGDIPIPADARAAVGARLGRPGPVASVPGPMAAFSDAAQVRRVGDVAKVYKEGRPGDAPPYLGDALDEVAFGPTARRRMNRFTDLEALAAQTEQTNPWVQQTLRPDVAPAAADAVRLGSRLARDFGNTAGNPAGTRGILYGVADVGNALAARMGRVSPEQAAGLLTAGYAPRQAQQNALFRMIQQTNTGYNTPGRRLFGPVAGLLGGQAEIP